MQHKPVIQSKLRHLGILHASLCLIFIVTSNSVGASPIDAIVGRVSQTDYSTYVQDLQNFNTRYLTSQGNVDALTYIYNAFVGFGLTTAYDNFTYNNGSYNNIVATLPGKTHPENVYIVGAHMDSTSNDAANKAPGADDNASGMAAVLEMAKILVGNAFDATIKFFGFNAEEQGLVGSKAYADKAIANHENVLGMLNFDMIAYPVSGTPKGVFLGGDAGLVDALAANALKYTSSLKPSLNYANYYGSDHFYFHSTRFSGSSSAFAIEAYPVNNPNYHQKTDTTAYLDFAYATDITRMGLATVAGLAGVVPEPPDFLCFLIGMIALIHRVVLSRK